jgi:DHA1 family bicyclomycin/chloramphenicol resistance-like MFS transporter
VGGTARMTGSWRLLVLLIAMTAIGPLSLNILVPAVPGLAATFAADPAYVQLTISLYLFGLATSQLALGPLSDRYGRRPVVLAGLTLTALASTAAIFAASIDALIVARVVQALGASTGVVIGRAIIRDLYARERAASMIGLVTTATVVAPMIAPLIGGVLDTAFGWQAIFVFVAAASVLVLSWAVVALPETRAERGSEPAAHFRNDLAALARNAPFIGYVLAASLGSAAFFSFLGGGPYVVVGIMGRSSAEYGLWFAFAALGFMAGNFTVARMSHRFGIDAMIYCGIAIEFAGAVLALAVAEFWFAAGPAIIFLPQMVIGFGNGILLPNSIAGAVSVRPQAAGTAAGLTGFTQMAMGACAAQFTGWALVGATDARPLMLTMLAVVAATAVAFPLLARRR